ncbi:MAG: DUF6502 family protein [Leptothrix ochracea]|uniref:DUF6502 family protein n=2 Tax=Leptothrix ochracea TaxID=735331 RepID=UPI0034E1F9C5
MTRMTETSPDPSELPAGSDPRAQLALEQSLVVIQPLVSWLLRNGVHHGALAQALKGVFLTQARAELEQRGSKVTDSALSVLSGVHRKDVRLFSQAAPTAAAHAPTPAAMLFTRWITDAGYRGVAPDSLSRTVPLSRLPRHGPPPSFEALARDVSSDVHPRTLLEELQRLGFVRVEDEDVLLETDRFISQPGDTNAARTLAVNAADHLAAAVHNLTAPVDERFLEQSVFADGLSQASAAYLAARARELWAPAFEAMVASATARVQRDEAQSDTPMRVRFGVYYYHEAVTADPAPTAPAAPAADPFHHPKNESGS